jgi:N-dimethylarginine dimethylaminohydrolase
MPERRFGGQSMVAPLRRVLLCGPRAAGWDEAARADRWRDLGYLRAPDAGEAAREHDRLRREIEAAGVEIADLPDDPALSLDAVYAHDASIVADGGAILLRMGKPARAGEPGRHAAVYRSLGVPIAGAIRDPGTAEGGDLVWLDPTTLLAGRGYRTNNAGIEQLRSILSPSGVEVIAAPLPHGPGPSACLHLMSLMSALDERTILVDLGALAVQTVELLRARDARLIEIDPSERETLACNVLALGDGVLLALEANARTNDRLRRAGFEVRTFPGREVAINGSGGPTCLTRPLWRGAR